MITEILRGFGRNVRACYSWKNIGWQLVAVALTYGIVVAGFDWYWFTHTRDATLQSWLFTATALGGLLPVALPIVLLLVGKAWRDIRTTIAAYAITQAAILGILISSFYKFFTGRIPPPFRAQTLVDISHQFNFGLFRDGVFWGWPSSHTTVAFAVAVTLFVLYKNNPFVKYSALLAAFYIGISVSTNIHWFSEFIAGAIIGSIIGVVVGASFKRFIMESVG